MISIENECHSRLIRSIFDVIGCEMAVLIEIE